MAAILVLAFKRSIINPVDLVLPNRGANVYEFTLAVFWL